MTYGHGKLLVTPLQQVAAVAAIANGGKLMTPHIVKSITDPLTGETTVTKPEVVKQVISQESAKKTGEYLEQVVSDLKIVITSYSIHYTKLYDYEMLGPDLMKQYVDNFGFGQATGIELPGEARGVVSPVITSYSIHYTKLYDLAT